MPYFLREMAGLSVVPVGFAILTLNTPICILLSCDRDIPLKPADTKRRYHCPDDCRGCFLCPAECGAVCASGMVLPYQGLED